MINIYIVWYNNRKKGVIWILGKIKTKKTLYILIPLVILILAIYGSNKSAEKDLAIVEPEIEQKTSTGYIKDLKVNEFLVFDSNETKSFLISEQAARAINGYNMQSNKLAILKYEEINENELILLTIKPIKKTEVKVFVETKQDGRIKAMIGNELFSLYYATETPVEQKLTPQKQYVVTIEEKDGELWIVDVWQEIA